MAILGNADMMLLDMDKDRPERHGLEEIKRATRRASDLTNQLLAYSGRGKFVVRTVTLNDLVREMGHLLDVSITKKAIIRYELANELPPLMADPNQIRQVVMNLITNASDAIGDANGSITIRTRVVDADRRFFTDTISHEDLPDGRYVAFEVTDTGCGMDDETRLRIFDPFFSTKFTGRGLGLAAVLGIVRGHEGTIKVTSVPGRGSTFLILLPASEQPSPPEATPASAGAYSDWRASGGLLIVDDEESVRNVARNMIRRLGFDVFTAEDGIHALERFEALRSEIRLVLLDMSMPRMDGLETFEALRRIGPRPADHPLLWLYRRRSLPALHRKRA